MVNATEPKKLTNHRASGSDDAPRIAPKTLDDAGRMHGIYSAG